MGAIERPAENLRPLTSLRFVAAMMIVLFHAKNYFHWPFLAYVPGAAAFGVSFFFVLSGFILTHVYGSKPFPGYWRFIALRVGRLWPVHMAATAIVVASVFFPIIRPDSLVFEQPGFLFNRWTELALVTGLSQSLSPYLAHIYAWNSPSWSISTEMFFYLAFPWLLADIGRTWHWKLFASAAIAIGLTVLLRLFDVPYQATGPFTIGIYDTVTANPLGRLFEFCLGMSACVLWSRYIRHLGGGVLIWTLAEVVAIVGTLFWCLHAIWPLMATLPTFMQPWFYLSGPAWPFAVLIVTTASGRGLVGRTLSTAPTVLLGEVSFSVYLLHQVLMKIYFTHHLVELPPIAFFAPLLALSTASFFLIESPARNFVARIVKRQTRAASLSAPA